MKASDKFYMFISFLEWSELVIPCRSGYISMISECSLSNSIFPYRPSMPDVSVSYQLVSSITNTSESLSYDVTRGFTALHARAEQHTGSYTCTFTRGNLRQTQIIHIIITRESPHCQNTEIFM